MERPEESNQPMEPIVFGGCFGWLHGADSANGAHAGRGVVLCSPFGYDILCTHRGWRKLAEGIAARGMPALRFDYPGSGDSAGVEEDPGRIDAWLDSIDAAIETLRARTGVTEVALCGFRLGALLAARAAERRGGVDALVLLAPVISGRQYVRELRAHRQSWATTPAGFSADPLPDTNAYVEAFGFGVHGEDVARLSALDLTKVESSVAKRVLLLDSRGGKQAANLASRHEALGSEVETGPFDECDRFQLEALYSEVPHDVFLRATDWLARDMPPRAGGASASKQTCHELKLPAQGLCETPVSFDVPYQDGRYFGMHCVPDRIDPELPAVLFCNTGASHHIGDGRMFVLFARRLAEQGIASLRMDLAGLGDSSPLSPTVTLDTIYADASGIDVAAGAQWLVSQGYRRVVVVGVCGGAFNGLHGARRHPAIVGCVGVNLQKFIWDGEDRAPGTPVFAQSRLYWRSAFSLKKWLAALHGKANPMRAARAISQRAWRLVRARTGDVVARVGGEDKDPIRTLARDLAAKGVQVRLVYGEFDVGLEELKIHFGTHGSGLGRYPSIRVVLLPKLDHALFTGAAREAVMRDTETWLMQSMREPVVSKSDAKDASQMRQGADRRHAGLAPDAANPAVAVTETDSDRQGDTALQGAHFPGVGS
ncbi:Serine aminopeptidase, S33 [Paraburkholderia sartisoli]|uniref:Serine aminopeptidase, S33 n=2 Tax=Paraburkholderia sartisoli TaxID=83784 RepID=A0A1H4ECU7_9BURK|nr:Serine aminopeptidase, S33 [Paraburkholderia sartisoli]